MLHICDYFKPLHIFLITLNIHLTNHHTLPSYPICSVSIHLNITIKNCVVIFNKSFYLFLTDLQNAVWKWGYFVYVLQLLSSKTTRLNNTLHTQTLKYNALYLS